MDELVITGGKQLNGTVRVKGAKNAALPILAASLLAKKPVVLREVPDLEDIRTMVDLLNHLGAGVKRLEHGILQVEAASFTGEDAPYELVRKMRASFLVLGPILATHGRVRVSLPGGCAIGARPIDLHLKGFKAMGAKITMGYGFIEAQTPRLKGCTIYLDYPSVGATENLMAAACLAKGTTILANCAREPEVVDLANFLNALGAKVSGAGGASIEITGVESLAEAVQYSIIPDRIEAGTYLAAVAAAGGELHLTNTRAHHLRPALAKLREAGVEVEEKEEAIHLSRYKEISNLDFTTLPYPGFPTDLQPIYATLATRAKGVSIIRETVFENRFRYAAELMRMGADIRLENNVAVVYGNSMLYGTRVKAPDLRGGAALVVAALAAEGETKISCLHHLDRGYSGLEENLRSLGAEVQRSFGSQEQMVTA